MKKNYLLSFLFSTISFVGISQITVTDTELLDVGDIIYLADDDNTIVNVASAGQNQSWDFSALQSNDSWMMEVVDPTTTPFDQSYPTADMCIIEEGDFIYCNKSSSSVNMLGIGDSVFQHPLILVPLPLSYGFNSTDGPTLILDSLIGGPSVNFLLASQGLSASMLTLGAAHIADSLSIQVEMTAQFNVDAEGIMILPIGSFDALRLNIERTTTPSVSVYCIDTTAGGLNSDWYPLPFGGSESESSYQWYSNDVSAKFILAEVSLDSIGNPETGISFLTTSINSLEKIEIDYINIFPIPTAYNLTITSERNEEVGASLSDINGREIMNFVFVNSTELDLSELDKGIYILNLNTKEGSISKKLIIE